MKICDSICGSGKTSAAINYMREHQDERFLFITPFLTEVTRISEACQFCKPYNIDGKGKLQNLHNLLRSGKSVVSTHALFMRFTAETMQLVRDGGYTLILDEVADVVQIIDVVPEDIEYMIKFNVVQHDAETNTLVWLDNDYPSNGALAKYRAPIESGNAVWLGNELFVWFMPIELFYAFKEVFVLTYMFEAQIQRHYFDMCGAKYEYIGTRFNAEKTQFEFCGRDECLRLEYKYADKFHILEHEKLNAIGDEQYSLSAGWYEKNRDGVEQMRKNLVNLFQKVWNSPSADNLWTTYKKSKSSMRGKGYTKGFVQCHEKATNVYADKTHLAYTINLYMHVGIATFLRKHGIEPDQDAYALSEMLQWLFRSAVRNRNDVWVYVPSRRMRELLRAWCERYAVAKGA